MISLTTPSETQKSLALHLKEARLNMNISQETLAQKAQVSLSVLRKFEQTYHISLKSFIKLAFVLGLSDPILEATKPTEKRPKNLDDLLQSGSKTKKTRKKASPNDSKSN